MRIAALALIVLLSACQSGGRATTTVSIEPPHPLGGATPQTAVRDWVTQLGDGDFQSTELVVVDDQVALLVSVEGMTPEQIASMLEEVPPEVRQNFWRGFAESFPAFAGEGVSDLVVGDVDQFELAGDRFAAVQVVFRERVGSGWVVTRQGGGGRWFVDLFATFGHAFARPLLSLAEELPHEGDGAVVRRAMGEFRSSLQAALEFEPLGELGASTRSDLQLLIARL